MSSHGRSILGATFRQTCGFSASRITARQLPSPPPPYNVPQVTKVTFSPKASLKPISNAYQNISINHRIASNTPQHGGAFAFPVEQFRFVPFPRQLESPFLYTSHAQLVPFYQHYYSSNLRSSWFAKGRTSTQSRHYSDKSTETRIKILSKDNATPQSRPKSASSPKATDTPRVTPGPMVGKHFIDRLPNIPQVHRPSKEELLAAATGFWSRLRVRFKWFSIRSGRPFNVDEISAFFSWVLLGHVLWIVLGTTTFFSLAILAVNTVFAQGWLHSF